MGEKRNSGSWNVKLSRWIGWNLKTWFPEGLKADDGNLPKSSQILRGWGRSGGRGVREHLGSCNESLHKSSRQGWDHAGTSAEMFLKQINKIYSYKLLGSGACALKLSEDLKCEALNYFWQEGVFKYILVAERKEANDAKSSKGLKEGAGSLNSASSMKKKTHGLGWYCGKEVPGTLQKLLCPKRQDMSTGLFCHTSLVDF